MQISTWLKLRKTRGSIPEVARRILESNSKYRDIEKALQGAFVLEAILKHDCSPTRAAEAIGVTRTTIHRVMRDMKITTADIRVIARQMAAAQ